MTKHRRKYISMIQLLFGLVSVNHQAFSKTSLHYAKWNEKITVFPVDNYFSSEIQCNGSSLETSSAIFIPYSETEKVENIHVDFFDPAQNLTMHDSVKVLNNSYSGEAFYQNLWTYHFEIPATSAFTYTYTKHSEEIFLLAALDLNPMSFTDSVEYEILVPHDHILLYKACNIDTTIQLKTDSSISGKFTRYHFIAINHQVKKSDQAKRISSLPCYLHSVPAIKLVVVPVSEKSRPEAALNNWCLKLYDDIPKLSKSTFDAIVTETGPLNDTDALIKSVFRFVQQKIKYIAIENGMNAFRPRDPNLVYKNRQGDCKDMSFLLYSILKHYGINAYIALSASIAHPFDMDFPSLASANHNICAVERHSSWVFLDATENECEYGTPSTQIQGKQVFIVGKNMAIYVKVKPVPAPANRSDFNISFKVGDKLSEGRFSYAFTHSSASQYKNLYASLNKTDFDLFIKTIFKDFADGCSHELSPVDRTDTSITFTGTLSLNSDEINTFSGQTYFSLEFMPYLDQLPKIIKVTDPLICYSTLNKRSKAEFAFDAPVHLKNSRTKKFEENGFMFEFSVEQPDKNHITANTKLLYNDVTITGSRLESFRKMILYITTELRKGIVYE